MYIKKIQKFVECKNINPNTPSFHLLATYLLYRDISFDVFKKTYSKEFASYINYFLDISMNYFLIHCRL